MFLSRFHSVYSCQLRCYSKKTTTTSPVQLLDRLYQLSADVNATESVIQKRAILKKYPDCQTILKRIYDPHRRHFVSSKTALGYMNRTKKDTLCHDSFTSLEDLLDALSSRLLTGHNALKAISSFFGRYCTTPTQQQVFWRVLDRDLKIGVSIQTVRWLLSAVEAEEEGHKDTSIETTQRVSASISALSHQQQNFIDRRFMTVALATNMKPAEEDKLWNHTTYKGPYYVSRKLDGIRCLTLVQWSADNQPHIIFCSRTGRTFDSLSKVEAAIRQQLDQHPCLERHQDFVLDGEICIYQPRDSDINTDDRPRNKDAIDDEDDDDDGRKEDFLEALRQVKTMKKQVESPVYQVFDIIPMDVFQQGKGGPLFNVRQQKLQELFRSYQGDCFKVLKQKVVSNKEELDLMKQKVGRFGWEGLILRKNVEYEGKRSRNMLKIKEWEDAEYVVQSIETGYMRLAGWGHQVRVVTNVIVDHKGNNVSVGSGFSLQQRMDYANNPERILGKLITVKYFSESFSENGKPSLRFPTVKAVYEDNERD